MAYRASLYTGENTARLVLLVKQLAESPAGQVTNPSDGTACLATLAKALGRPLTRTEQMLARAAFLYGATRTIQGEASGGNGESGGHVPQRPR